MEITLLCSVIKVRIQLNLVLKEIQNSLQKIFTHIKNQKRKKMKKMKMKKELILCTIISTIKNVTMECGE